MREDLVQQLTETDYIQIGDLDFIRIKPLLHTNGRLDDVEIEVARTVPRYLPPVDSPLGNVLNDRFYWSIRGRWDDILGGGDVLISHGFTRDSNSILGASYLRDCPFGPEYGGRRFSTPCDPEWDFVVILSWLKHRPRYNCLYRFSNQHWSILEWSEEKHHVEPGNIWYAEDGSDVVETHSFKGQWKRLD